MHPIDIISESPKLCIFLKEKNKTNFGGILFLIYIVSIILIIIYYVIDYARNNKYIVQSFSHFNSFSPNQWKKDELFNPNISLKFTLTFIPNDFRDNFKFIEVRTETFFDENIFISKKLDGLFFEVLYECKNRNCSDYYEIVNETNIKDFFLHIEYEGFDLDHQNKKEPIIRKKGNSIITFKKHIPFQKNLTNSMTFNLKTIIYTEKKGFLQNDINSSCRYIENYSHSLFDHMRILDFNNKSYVELILADFEYDKQHYNEYFRKRISELDLLANILSLMANFFTGVRFIFGFYSDNFNNFKIIEHLLNNRGVKKIKVDQSSEMINVVNNKLISINNDLNKKDLNKNNNKESLLDENFKDNDNNDINLTDSKLSPDDKKMNKLRFFDFFLNNLYCCCKKQKQQQIIHICNEIVYKYSSLDSIIKNQILIENFLKDYKWNK